MARSRSCCKSARSTTSPWVARSSPSIWWLLAFAYLVTNRFMARNFLLRAQPRGAQLRRRTLIYGAGNAGAQMARAMAVSPEYRPVCFVDDHEYLQGKVVGFLDISKPKGDIFLKRLEELLTERYPIKEVIHRRKPTYTAPAPPSLREELANRCDVIIEALAD